MKYLIIIFTIATTALMTSLIWASIVEHKIEFINNNINNNKGDIILMDLNEIEVVVSNKQPKLDPLIGSKISSTIEKYSKEYNIPPELIISIIEIESSFRPTVTSSQNCIGLMQINPKAHPEKIKDMSLYEVYHIDNNIRIGCQIFSEYYKSSKSIEGALPKYYGANNKEYITKTLTSFTDMIMSKRAKIDMDEDV